MANYDINISHEQIKSCFKFEPTHFSSLLGVEIKLDGIVKKVNLLKNL
jgi:hypothetical protein